MLQQRAWCFSSNDNGSAVFLAFRTAKDFLDILDPFHFCGGNPQLLTDNLFPDDFHRGIAVTSFTISFPTGSVSQKRRTVLWK